MNLRKLFGIKEKDKKQYEYADVLHLWEDDYLMIELLPKENLEFIKRETNRINEFGKKHFDGNGFTDITVIGQKPFETIDKKIAINEVEVIFQNAELQKIDKVVMQGVGLLEGDKTPLAYGFNKFAIVFETKSGMLENIWLAGHTNTEIERKNLKKGLKEFGRNFDFIGVDWFKAEYYELQIEKYISNCC